MTSGNLIMDHNEKMTEMLSNKLNKSNRTLFLHLYIHLRFYLEGTVILTPPPPGEGGWERHPGAG